MNPLRLFATTGDAVVRLTIENNHAEASAPRLAGHGVMCVAADPHDPERVFVGTDSRGVYRSRDGGHTWQSVGEGMEDQRVLSIAVSPCDRVDGLSAVYAGTEPSNLYRSEDDGATWTPSPALAQLPSAATWSFPPRPWTHHMRWIALHPSDPNTIYVGIELGGVMVTRDRGQSWEDRQPHSQYDAHALATHPAAPERIYEAAGGGVALSDDAGATWQAVDAGMDRHYAWGLAIDAATPDLWYVSASHGPREAHGRSGNAQGVLYRKQGDAPWQPLGGNGSALERPSPFMPYALLAPRGQPNSLIAGLQNGDLLLTEDAGETWRRIETGLGELLALSESAASG